MNRKLLALVLIFVLTIFGIAVWKTQFESGGKYLTFERSPEGIMGTTCRLCVVMDFREKEVAKKILDKAEFRIRFIESIASSWIDESEVSLFNATPADVPFSFSSDNWAIIQYGAKTFTETNGAFDITCRPLIELWKTAGKNGELPTEAAIVTARQSSSWDLLEFGENETLTKIGAGARVDLGGIAKGYAIDEAVRAMVELGAIGGLVDIGGDLRFFGRSSGQDGRWVIDVKDPFKEGLLTSVEEQGEYAVCTSGNYARYVDIGGKRFSHILNPNTGYPTDQVPSVTVIAADAMTADVWATALSVTGPEGRELLPEGVEALMVYGERDSYEIYQTPDFPKTFGMNQPSGDNTPVSTTGN
jgi:FAD:protein FMN transferase